VTGVIRTSKNACGRNGRYVGAAFVPLRVHIVPVNARKGRYRPIFPAHKPGSNPGSGTNEVAGNGAVCGRGANGGANALLVGASLLLLAAPAQAHGVSRAGAALKRAGGRLELSAAACPPGVVVQAITVVNEAAVRPWVLAKVENALVAQSLQVRAAWGTPCVQFGVGGWPLYLVPNIHGWAVHYAPLGTGAGSFQDDTACSRRPDASLPCALVSVDADWTVDASHELVEMLADPSTEGDEICDPVEDWYYRVDGVPVSDFVFPAWFDASRGPYDEIGVLHHPSTV